MGIDIYLNGYEEYEARTVEARAEFEKAVKARDAFPRGSKKAEKAQKLVSIAAGKMWAGGMGYLRSSYNGGGLFRVLEEIYGFDIGEYFFPGSWDQEPGVAINGKEFCDKVTVLQHIAAIALSEDRRTLPWIDIYTRVTRMRAPDANAQRTSGEAFGDSVFKLISGLGFDKLKGGPEEPVKELRAERHGWYLAEGLKDLREFGELARRINKEGRKTFAYISY